MMHVKNHVAAAQPPAKDENKIEPAAEQKREGFNFLPEFLRKNIVIETMTGKQYSGQLMAFNAFELLLDVQGTKMIFWKHACVSMKLTGANV